MFISPKTVSLFHPHCRLTTVVMVIWRSQFHGIFHLLEHLTLALVQVQCWSKPPEWTSANNVHNVCYANNSILWQNYFSVLTQNIFPSSKESIRKPHKTHDNSIEHKTLLFLPFYKSQLGCSTTETLCLVVPTTQSSIY